MSTEFVIVIEVDNKRAARAYRKGLDDLDLALPQLLAQATRLDDKDRETYERAVESWEARKPQVQESCLGFVRKVPSDMAFLAHRIARPQRPSYRMVLLLRRISAQLRHMCDVAEAATAPYRMTEHQVSDMVAWENGSRIEALQRQFEV